MSTFLSPWIEDLYERSKLDTTIIVGSDVRRVIGEFRDSIAEAHRLLDVAGVPDATGAECNDAECNSKLGHRIRTLISKRDEYDREIDAVRRLCESHARAYNGCADSLANERIEHTRTKARLAELERS